MVRSFLEPLGWRRCVAVLLIMAAVAALLSSAHVSAEREIISEGRSPAAWHPSQTTVVSISPDAPVLWPGQTATLDVMVSDVSALYGFELHMSFNPSIIRVVDSDAGSQGINVEPGDFLSPDFVMANACSNVTGTITLAVAQVGREAQSGSGVLARITVEALQVGDGALGFGSVLLSNSNGLPIAPVLLDQPQVIVQDVTPTDGPSPTPTLTRTATLTPTASRTPTATMTTQTTATATATATTLSIPHFYVDPAIRTVQPGQTFTVTVRTSQVSQLSGVEVHLSWDAGLLRIIDQNPSVEGVQITQGNLFSGYRTFAPIYTVNEATGQLMYAYAMTEEFCVAGQWSVFTLTFQALGLGSSPLTFGSDSLMACMGLNLNTGWINGTVLIVEPTATPTLTLTPSQTPTPTETVEPTTPVVTATPTQQWVVSCNDILQNGNLETTGSTAWQMVGAAEVSTKRPHGGSYGAWLAGYDSAQDGIYQQVTLPSTALTATVQLWYNVETTETTHPHDYLYVELRDLSDTLLTRLTTISDAATPNTWLLTSADVSAYAGQTVRLAVRAETNATNFTSFYVDDIRLEVCALGEPLATATPTATAQAGVLRLPLVLRNYAHP